MYVKTPVGCWGPFLMEGVKKMPLKNYILW